MEALAQWLVDFVHAFGYAGIFIMAFLESTFVPLPSEITMIPAGYLVAQGHLHFIMVVVVSTMGALGGALANYYIAYHFGRRFLYNYGKYMFFSHEKQEKLDVFFASHGDISTFTGRLIPGLRHFIAFPAGLAHMNLKKFCIYTGLGSGIWMTSLVSVGYLIGGNKELVHHYTKYITIGAVTCVALLLTGYVLHLRSKKKGNDDGKL